MSQNKPTIEVLVTTMHATDTSLYERMNLQTDAIIANQADRCEIFEDEINGKSLKMITTATRGLSRNRNFAMMYSRADIFVFADDDQVFVDGYEDIIRAEFEKAPDADAIKFYCESTNPERPLAYKRPNGFIKATKKRLMSSGVVCLAMKRESFIRYNAFFRQNLGSGGEIFCGEDSVYFSELCAQKAKIYLSPTLLSRINQGESSWFKGYTEQYFIARGYLYKKIYGPLRFVAFTRMAWKLKGKKDNKYSFTKMLSLLRRGARIK